MSIVYRNRGQERRAFIEMVFEELQVQKEVTGKHILIKPNIVSYEPYPTTTHPETLAICLRLLSDFSKRVTVADGPAWDAGDSKSMIERHPLKQTCDEFGVTLVDLLSKGTKKVKTRSFELDVAQLAFECDFILSLPVLKSHMLGLTGALKNHVGFLSSEEKLRSHRVRDMSQVIAELHEVFKPRLYVVDAVQTLIKTNEVRHGGQPTKLGYMLAGTDPVSLDVAGLELLKEVESKLVGKQYEDISQIRHAVTLGIGEAQYEVIE